MAIFAYAIFDAKEVCNLFGEKPCIGLGDRLGWLFSLGVDWCIFFCKAVFGVYRDIEDEYSRCLVPEAVGRLTEEEGEEVQTRNSPGLLAAVDHSDSSLTCVSADALKFKVRRHAPE